MILFLFSLSAAFSAGAAPADSQSALESLEEKGIRFIPAEFIDAIQDGDGNRVNLFLAAGMSPDAHDTGSGALQAAAAGDHLKIMELLLAAGADPNRRDRKGRAALMYAVGEKWDSRYREGIRPLAGAGDPAAGKWVDALLAAGAQPNLADNDGRTALMYAAEACSVDATNSLIDAGASVHQKDRNGLSFVDIFNRSQRWYQSQVIQHQEQRKAKAGGKQAS